MSQGDISSTQPIKISTIPAGINNVTTASNTIAAGTAASFLVTNTPSSFQGLSLWNFLFSLVIDDLTINSAGLYTHLLSSGSDLTAGQLNCSVDQWIDWSLSYDVTGSRAHRIRIHNNDSSPHTYYLFYKAYLPAAGSNVH